MNIPNAPVRPHLHTEHDVERVDPWFWMRDRKDPQLMAYLEAENAYTEAQVADLQPLSDPLFAEMKGRIQETDSSAPVRDGNYWYYHRTVEGLSYPIYCRKQGSLKGKEEVILDVNKLADGHDFLSLGALAVSPDHSRLAYAVDVSGREKYDVVIIDLYDGTLLDQHLRGTSGDIEWANDNRTLLYTDLDKTLRPWRVRAHMLGYPTSEDVTVFEEADDKFRVGLSRTRTDAYLVITVGSGLTSEVHLLDANQPSLGLHLLQPRHTGMRYGVAHHTDSLYILTDDSDDDQGVHTKDAVNYKLMLAPVDSTDRAQWKEVIAHRPGVQLVSVQVFEDFLVLLEREDGLQHIRVRNLATGEDHRVEMPEAIYDLGLGSNPEFKTTEVRFSYESMVTPTSTFGWDMNTQTRRLIKEKPVLGGFSRDDWSTERIYATADDGVQVPISIVYPKGMKRDGTEALLLYGYGSYGITIDAGFTPTRLALLDRGVAFAIAHPRGGGLLGRPWYEAGKFLTKRRTFTDFIAVAKHLIAEDYTNADRLAIMGGSAGGMLMGGVCNMAPELFHCCVAAVPFVDVVTTMFDESLPLTANEWEEWGDPRDEEFFEYMLSYSPYDNVEDRDDYPNLLITSGLNDPRVQYWEPTKWCAKLRATLTEPKQILLKTHMGAGHQGKSGRYGYLEDRAFDYAWVLNHLGADRD
ncbi:MAG: prolyl oligopeptidase family serine peptidase [Rhodobacterales bacterium]|nr:prolyl oligopeptidase family serine peptidase [Rhodobacterales bacterium]